MSLYTVPFNLDKFREKVENILNPMVNESRISRESLIKDHSIDPDKVAAWLTLFNEADREAAAFIVDHIRHISWPKVREALLKRSAKVVSELEGDFGFYAESAKHKSNSFFTSIAYREVFNPSGKEPSFANRLDDIGNVHNLVLVDDMTYSGSQLLGILNYIAEQKGFRVVEGESIEPSARELHSKGSDFFPIIKAKKVDLTSLKKDGDFSVTMISHHFGDTYIFARQVGAKYRIPKQNKYQQHKISELLADIKKFTIEYGDKARYVGTPSFYLDISEKALTAALSVLNVYICFAFVSKKAEEMLKKFDKKHTNINLYYPPAIPNTLDKIIKDAPVSIRVKVKIMLAIYLGYIDEWTLEIVKWDPDEIEWMETAAVPVYFDHKLASPVSSLPVLLGCGFVLSPTDIETALDEEKPYKVRVFGSLLRNCPKATAGQLQEMRAFSDRLYPLKSERFGGNRYDPEKDEKICIICPKPVYKLTTADISRMLTK